MYVEGSTVLQKFSSALFTLHGISYITTTSLLFITASSILQTKSLSSFSYTRYNTSFYHYRCSPLTTNGLQVDWELWNSRAKGTVKQMTGAYTIAKFGHSTRNITTFANIQKSRLGKLN